MFDTIVVATDGSKHAAKACEAAADIAAKYASKLVIVTVLPAALALEELEAMPQVKRFAPEVQADIKHFRSALVSEGRSRLPSPLVQVPAPHSAIAALGEEILKEAEEVARQKGVARIERLVLGGHPAEAIVRTAKDVKATLIVMGTRGLSDLEGVFIGSISHKVIHMAACACLTVK